MSSTDPADSSALRAGFGFVVTEETSAVQANFSGRIEHWNYVDGTQPSNPFEASLSGRLNWFIVPETFSFTGEDSLEMRWEESLGGKKGVSTGRTWWSQS